MKSLMFEFPPPLFFSPFVNNYPIIYLLLLLLLLLLLPFIFIMTRLFMITSSMIIINLLRTGCLSLYHCCSSFHQTDHDHDDYHYYCYRVILDEMGIQIQIEYRD